MAPILRIILFLQLVTLVHAADRPHIVLILTDDMGYSDIGCFGGEIDTPNIDALAKRGLKFSQFYNCGKCEPSRAALVSGHQFWTHHPDIAIRRESPNVGEVLQEAGYRTMMVGKWHCEGVPYERGFDRHFGFMTGGCDFFVGNDTFTLDGKPWQVPQEDFYVTSALTEHADRFIREEHAAHPDSPCFLYLAYNAPHSPIQAPAKEVAKYRGRYRVGWDEIRRARFAKQQALGLAGPSWAFPQRPADFPAWSTLDEASRDFEDLRMATYAAMIDCVDQGVGQLMNTLEQFDIVENTLVIFMNDNGASPNDRARRGDFGTAKSTWNLGAAWAHASNTPLKYYKRAQHGGGVTTPFIASWPAHISPEEGYDDQPLHIIDLLPTFMDLAGTNYPNDFGEKQHPPLPGRSFVTALTERETLPPKTLHFSLFNNFAIIDRGWRLVTAYDKPWQLYHLDQDRTETTDLATTHPERLEEMLAMQAAFERRPDVRLRLKPGEREPTYSPIYRSNGRIAPASSEKVPDERAALQRAKQRSMGMDVR
ncbi:MAG: arylsulfatase [Verrucomicrobiota bacterium]